MRLHGSDEEREKEELFIIVTWVPHEHIIHGDDKAPGGKNVTHVAATEHINGQTCLTIYWGYCLNTLVTLSTDMILLKV